MATIWIPSLMRGLTGGLAEVQASGATVREVIDDLDARYPGIKARLVDDDRLKPNIALVVDGTNSKRGLRHALTESSEVHFVPAISGGNATPLPLSESKGEEGREEGEAETSLAPSGDSLSHDLSNGHLPLPSGERDAKPTRAQRVRAAALFVLAVLISIVVIALSTHFRDALLAFGQLGLVGLFVLSIVGNATVFIPAPAFVVACAAGPLYGPLATGAVAGLGSAVGEMTAYMAGYGGTAVLPQGELYARLHGLMKRYGPVVIFVMAALPNPLFDVGGLIAGALKMRPALFLVATATGKAVRLGLIAFACTGGLPWLVNLVGPPAP